MRRLAVALATGLVLAAPTRAAAEPYVAIFGGAVFAQDTDVETTLSLDNLSFLDGTLHDVAFDPAPIFGGKFGYFFERQVLRGHLGLELEVAHIRLQVSEQTIRFSGTALGRPVDVDTPIQDVEVDVTSVGLHALYRLPLAPTADHPRGRVQPYVGLGVDLWIASFSTRTTPLDVNQEVTDTDVQPALQALAGVKLFVTRHLALFAEYKFLQTARATFTSTASGTRGGMPVTERAVDRADVTSHVVVGGIAVHW